MDLFPIVALKSRLLTLATGAYFQHSISYAKKLSSVPKGSAVESNKLFDVRCVSLGVKVVVVPEGIPLSLRVSSSMVRVGVSDI